MRVEPYEEGSFVHCIKRGTRGLDIVRDEDDRRRFVRSLYYLNDTYSNQDWKRQVEMLDFFERPSHWPEREPLVRIIAWTLMPNHFHILFEEIRSGGISKFMQRICGSMAKHFNAKYGESGSLFQGAYRSKTIDNDSYLHTLAFYVMVKNVFELYPNQGLIGALEHFDVAWKWAIEYPYSSLPVYALEKSSPIVDGNIFKELFPTTTTFKKEAKERLSIRYEHTKEIIAPFILENW